MICAAAVTRLALRSFYSSHCLLYTSSSFAKRIGIAMNRENKRVYKVVLTGGPCGGKTTGQDRLATFFENLGWKVFTVPETATVLLRGGIKFAELTPAESHTFQEDLLRTMMHIEDVFFHLADTCTKDCLVICDRGTMDASAYINEREWKQILARNNFHDVELRDNRYHQIVHLVTAANGAEQFYSLDNNKARSEGLEQACNIDGMTSQAWLGHPYFDIIENSGCHNFDDKILKLIQVVCDRAGIQYGDRLAPDSRKRKFLISSIDETRMPKNVEFRVTHDYLASLKDATSGSKQSRIRKRGQGGKYSYTHTIRRMVNDEHVETRMQLSAREYDAMKRLVDISRTTVHKIRRCFTADLQYYQLDIFQAPWKGLVLLETYTTKTGDELKPPGFLQVEKEVTNDPAYSMYNLALKNPKERLAVNGF